MIRYDPGSFKDPSGRVFHYRDNVYRTLSPEAVTSLRAARDAGLLGDLEREDLVLPGDLLAAADEGLVEQGIGEWVLKQPRVAFVSYSYEWSFEMLRDAALVTLRIMDRALSAGFILKDATAFNILFD